MALHKKPFVTMNRYKSSGHYYCSLSYLWIGFQVEKSYKIYQEDTKRSTRHSKVVKVFRFQALGQIEYLTHLASFLNSHECLFILLF